LATKVDDRDGDKMPSQRAEIMSGAGPEAGRELLVRLGPGLVTGASDDDPSGIATYSQVGAQFGLGMLWTMLFSLPLMIAMQEICARLGRITGVGIAESVRGHYSPLVAVALTSLLCLANIFNLGADISAMADVARSVAGGSASVYALLFGALSVVLQVYVPYRVYVRYLKWLTLVLFAYVAAAFVARVPWKEALWATLMPRLSLNPDYFMALVAVLGTTISPYLFFWQTSQEAEDIKVHEAESSLRRRPSQALAQFRRIAMGHLVMFHLIAIHDHGGVS
jgi:NRAMP (natural resistance-associated macrophage protein)-like metal ion transporter